MRAASLLHACNTRLIFSTVPEFARISGARAAGTPKNHKSFIDNALE
jgi:hypothetical protein